MQRSQALDIEKQKKKNLLKRKKQPKNRLHYGRTRVSGFSA